MNKLLTNFVLVMLVASACSNSDSSVSATLVSAISLREYLPTLQEHAHRWRADAYLVEAKIPLYVGPESNRLWLIVAHFQATSEDKLSLSVTLELDGRITTEEFTHIRSIYQTQPITDNEWPIDSPDALQQLFKARGLDQLSPHDRRCSSLDLVRDHSRANEPVLWVLSLWGCGLADPEYYYLDPISTETGVYVK